MDDLSQDFDNLAERADDYGALWALRTLYRILSAGDAVHSNWPGTLDQARRLVAAFADRVGFSERETLAHILQETAALTWADSLHRIESA
jgi:hypothetical protein